VNYDIYILIALFLFIFVPIFFKVYKKDQGEYNIAKSFNLIISLLLFFLFTSITKNELSSAFNDISEFRENVFVEAGILSSFLSGLSWLLYVIMFVLFSYLLLQISLRREKSRLLFLRLLPLFWIINSANFYRYVFIKYEATVNHDFLIPKILFINGFFVFIMYIFYSNKSIKKVFYVASN